MRPFFTGILGFGLVAIPIQLFKAIEEEKTAMHWLHRLCHSRIQYQKWCPHCQRPVALEELEKAVEVEPGGYVVVEPPIPTTSERAVSILSFHPAKEIDPMLYKSAYWVKPGQGGAKPYRLLAAAMQSTGLWAVAEVRLRTRTELVVVRPLANLTLALHGLHYPESIRQEGAQFGQFEVRLEEREEAMAVELVQAMQAPFRPEAYLNRERAEWLRRVEEQRQQRVVRPPEAAELGTPVAELLDRLEASLKATQRAQAPARRARSRRAGGSGGP